MWWKFDQWLGVCCKEVRCSQAEVRAVPAAAGTWKARWEQLKNVCSWRKLSRDHLFFLMGVLEAHSQGRLRLLRDIFMAICVLSILTCERQSSSFPLPLSTNWISPRQQWRKPCISVGARSRSLGTADSAKKTCGQLVENNFAANSSCGDCFFFFDCKQKH